MSFQDKGYGQPVITAELLTQPFNTPVTAPLDVVAYGGLNNLSATIGASSSSTILPAPASGKAYRLHRMLTVDFVSLGASQIILSGLVSGFFYSTLVQTRGVDNLEGQLAGEGLFLNNQSTGSIRVSLTYDLVWLPSIS